jgi:fatty-acyl-CoA synthase
MLPWATRRAALTERFSTWQPSSLGGWLDACAGRYGDRPFVITDDVTHSYREVAELSDRYAEGLLGMGVAPGDRIGLLMANFPEFVALKFAIAKAGAVAVPMNFLYRTDELDYVLRQSRVGVLITMTGFAGLDHMGMVAEVLPRLPLLRSVIQLSTDGRHHPGWPTVDELSLSPAEPTRRVPVDPQTVGDILYTSGTTGFPKGVQVTHDAVLRTAYASALTRGFADGRRILFSLPCYHMFGYVEGLLAATMVGGAVIPLTAFDAGRYLAAIDIHRANDILCVPTMTIALLEHLKVRWRDLSSLQAVLCGAAPAPSWLWERVRKELGATEIVTGYGMTECGGAMTLTRPDDPPESMATTVGAPKLAGAAGLPSGLLCEYRTVDPGTGAPTPDGADGELISRGPTHMPGYWDDTAETAKALRNGWVFSGDLGRVRADGYLEVGGRTKELYKSGGELVMPKEIEDLLTSQDGISQAFAVGIPDERWGEVGCVIVVRASGSTIDADDVIGICRANLARFKVPKRVVFLPAAELPTTPTGKVQKFRLAAMASQ